MKFKRLPNGFGQISKLSGTRSRPYMVRNSERKVIDYAESYEDAYLILCEYNKTPWNIEERKSSLKKVWEIFLETDFSRYSRSRQKAFRTAFNHLKPLYDEPYASLKTYHFITFLNSLTVSDNTRNQIIGLLKHLDDTAYQLDIIEKKYAYELKGYHVERKSKRTAFTEAQVETLWSHVSESFVGYILILIYTGLRVNELISLKKENFDLENWTITAGSKTKAGKNRVIPIHPRIRPLVSERFSEMGGDKFYPGGVWNFEVNFKSKTSELLGRGFVPHEARHTMRTRLDRVGANKVAVDRILGHKSGDTGMDIYTHKSLEELTEAVLLLP